MLTGVQYFSRPLKSPPFKGPQSAAQSNQTRRKIMLKFRIKRSGAFVLVTTIALVSMFTPLVQVRAADHADSTSVAGDPAADIGDTFAFLDPTDNTKVILEMTVAGFIVPSEALNLGFFPSGVVYRFEIENTGDAIPDQFIDVEFTEQTSRSVAQTATVKFRKGRNKRTTATFTAPTTLPTLAAAANPFNVTTDGATGVKFYAGLTDDPFYFDIVGFGRFVTSVLGGAPNATQLQRGRDSFAGYNIHTIAVSVPSGLLRGSGNIVGVNGVTLRRQSFGSVASNSKAESRSESRIGEELAKDDNNLVQIDRAATPAVNTALIPFVRKNEFNSASTNDDAHGRFATDIVATLTALGTNSANIGILASVAVTNGDILRLNLSTPNLSLGFGERATTPGYTGFPNGRRPGDDTIDVLLYFITNQALTTGDNVNSNEVPLSAAFPFLAPPNQPLSNPAVDNTRN